MARKWVKLSVSVLPWMEKGQLGTALSSTKLPALVAALLIKRFKGPSIDFEESLIQLENFK